MDILNSLRISSSGLKAQATRLDTISSNLANAETTSTPEGGAYRRKAVYFETQNVNSFQNQLNNQLAQRAQGVKVAEIIQDQGPFRKVYDPGHPDAGEDGYVDMPNVDVLKEMVDMMSATRSYQANVSAIESAKRMALKALEIGK